jgi:CO/xanthine dehydrogenase Mo-binding subunit
MSVRSISELRAASSPRPDAGWKVAGGKGFLTDMIPDNALSVRVWRSPIPHGRILSVDIRRAAAMTGVLSVLTASDVPGLNGYGPKVRDQPVLCADRVRMCGDPVVAIAAESPKIADEALEAIHVELEPLPAVLDPAFALAPGTIAVGPNHNLCYERRYTRGDFNLLTASDAMRIADTYETGRQLHIAMETEGGFVVPHPDGRFSVHVGSHFPHGDRLALAAILNIDPGRIEVVASPMGGSFGGKDALSIQPILILLASFTGRAVAHHRTRAESMALGETRHPFRMFMETSCDRSGRLLGHRADLLSDTGPYTTKGPDVMDTAFENAAGPYAFEALDLHARVAFTNNGLSGAFRGFGAVQVQFALEQQMDRLAAAVGLDPAVFREQNLRPLHIGPLDQVTTGAQHPSRVLSAISTHPLRHRSNHNEGGKGRFLRGTGLSLITKGEGFSKGGPNSGSLSLELTKDGRILLATGAVEMGQGAIPAAVAAVAAVLGISQTDVNVRLGMSGDPNAGPSAASRVTGMLYRGVQHIAPLLSADLLTAAADILGLPVGILRLGNGGVWDNSTQRNRPRLAFAELADALKNGLPRREALVPANETPSAIKGHGDFNAASALATVLVDQWTGAIRVERMAVAAACGPVLAPLAFAGQIEGGAVMGIGMALLEHMPESAGRFLHRNLDGYMIPTIADAPTVEIIALEEIDSTDTLGPRGIGEISINVAVPAVANAVADAIGVPIRKLPIHPADVLAALRQKSSS